MSFEPMHARALAALLLISNGGGLAVAAEPLAHTLPASSSATTGSVEVRVDNFTFSRPMLTIAMGTTVTWVNEDDIPHTIVAKDRTFRSKTLDTDDRFSFTFTTPGEFDYFCSLHPHMVGKVIVTQGSRPS